MKLNIGILGTRGIPNNYGGFEHIAACLAKGLSEKGHAVCVYNSHKHPYQEKEWNGVKVIHCFDPEYLAGTAGQFIYDYNCIVDSRKRKYDILLMLGYTSSSVWGKLYPKKSVVIINMDGMEWQRTKYSETVRSFLKYAEQLGVRYSDYQVADSPVIKEYLDKTYGINSRYIAYGASLDAVADENLLHSYALKKHDYFMIMARMEPENNIEMVLDGFRLSDTGYKCIVVGNTGNKFGKYLMQKYKDEQRIIFTGAIFNKERVQSLTSFCRLYFHGHSVGGTNPSLLDAMAAKPPLAAHDNPFNRAILKNNAQYFSNSEEVCKIISFNNYSNPLHIKNNYESIVRVYSWPKIIDAYEDLFITCYLDKKQNHIRLNEEVVYH